MEREQWESRPYMDTSAWLPWPGIESKANMLLCGLLWSLAEPGRTRRNPARTPAKLPHALSKTDVFAVCSASEPGGTRRGTRAKLVHALSKTNVFALCSSSEPGGTRAGTRVFVRTPQAKLTLLLAPRLLFILLKLKAG